MKKFNPINTAVVVSILVLVIYSSMIMFPEQHSATDLIYNDHIYSPNIKSVKLYIKNGLLQSIIDPPVTSIEQRFPFFIEFDELNEDAKYYMAKIILCNWDWTPNELKSIEYLDNYNEFDIQKYSYSVNTKIPYTHYEFIIPKLNIPGNFIIYIYDRDEPEKVIISRRFIIYDNIMNVFPELMLSNGINERKTNQQINFIINYQGIDVMNYQREIKVVIRQNYSWYKAITGLQPTIIDDQKKTAEYHHFNLENNFPGGNEYRFIEMKSSVSTGRNVDRIINKSSGVEAYIGIDKPRTGQAYGFWDDLNGAYYISTIDGREAEIEADYINTHFFLQSGEKYGSDVYLFGEISFRQPMPEYKMKYDMNLGGYIGNFLLKEGYYEYDYITSNDQYLVEGNHSETENAYDIIIYYRPPSKINDLIAGYTQFKSRRNN